MTLYIALVPTNNGVIEYHANIEDPKDKLPFNSLDNKLKELARKAVEKAELTCPYGAEQLIEVAIQRLQTKDGQSFRVTAGSKTVAIPQTQLTDARFLIEFERAIAHIPSEFHNFIRTFSREHSASLEETLAHARAMAHDLALAIATYNHSLRT